MKRKRPGIRQKIEAIRKNRKTLGELIIRIDKKIMKNPNWENIKAGENYDVDSQNRLYRFLKKLMQEESMLLMRKKRKGPRKL